jgi:hypothetical protein
MEYNRYISKIKESIMSESIERRMSCIPQFAYIAPHRVQQYELYLKKGGQLFFEEWYEMVCTAEAEVAEQYLF